MLRSSLHRLAATRRRRVLELAEKLELISEGLDAEADALAFEDRDFHRAEVVRARATGYLHSAELVRNLLRWP